MFFFFLGKGGKGRGGRGSGVVLFLAFTKTLHFVSPRSRAALKHGPQEDMHVLYVQTIHTGAAGFCCGAPRKMLHLLVEHDSPTDIPTASAGRNEVAPTYLSMWLCDGIHGLSSTCRPLTDRRSLSFSPKDLYVDQDCSRHGCAPGFLSEPAQLGALFQGGPTGC